MDTPQLVAWVDPRTGIVHVDTGQPLTQDPVGRALAMLTNMQATMRYLTAPRWKRPLLRLFRWCLR